MLVLFTPDTTGDGAGDNDGDYVVLAVTATTLTVDAGPGLTPQSPITGVIVWAQGSPADIPMVVADPTKQLQPRDVSLDFATNVAQQGTITRGDGGDWAADGFAAGQFATLTAGTDDTVDNSGLYRIVAVNGSVLTLDSPLIAGRQHHDRGHRRGRDGQYHARSTRCSPSRRDTITRRAQDGTWTSNGFVAGLGVTVLQTQSNNGTYRIDSISADGLTLTVRNLNGQLITFTSENTGASTVDVGVSAATSLQSPELTFTGNSQGQYVERNRGSWTDDGFAVGDQIKVTGTTAVAGMYTISSIQSNGRILNLTRPTAFTLYPSVVFGANVTVEGMLELDSPLTAGDLENATVGELGNSQFFDLTSWLAQILSQTATAAVTVQDGVSIGAVNDLTISAKATTDISTTTSSLIFGITKAVTNATATVTIGAATLQAGGKVEISSEIENSMEATTSISAGFNPRTIVGAFRLLPGPAITITIGEAHSTSATTLAAGSVVEGDEVSITATNDNEFETATNSVIDGLAKANTGFAIGVTVGTYTSSATVTVNGTVRSEGDLEVSAESKNGKDDFNANAGVQSTPYPLAGGGKISSLLNGFGGGNLFQLNGTSDASAIALSGAVAVGSSINSAVVTIGATAVLTSREDLTVKSYAEDNFNVNAISWTSLSQSPGSTPFDPKQGSVAKVSLSGAVGVGSYTNTATTTITAGASLNAAGTMTVSSEAIMPIQLRIFEWIDAVKKGPQFDPEPSTTPTSDDPINNGQQVDASTTEKFAWFARQAGHLSDYLFDTLFAPFSPNTLFEIGEYFTSTSVEAVSGGTLTTGNGSEEPGAFAASGTVLVLTIVNSSSTVIGSDVDINTEPDEDFEVEPEDDQQVDITATSSVEMVNDAGIAALVDLLYFAYAEGVNGKIGVGGTAQQIVVTTRADAHVEDGASIAALGGVSVRSTDHSFYVVVTQQLGEAEKVGVVGAYTLLQHTGTSLAYLEDTVTVDTEGDLVVDAGTDTLAVTVSGVMQRGGVVAVGAGVSINAFDFTTRAFIGNADGSQSTAPVPADGISLAVGGALTVNAHSQELLVAVGIAATEPKAGNEAGGGNQPAPAGAGQALNNAGGQVGQANSVPSFGFGLSASVSVNFMSDLTQAYVDVPGAVTVGGALSITATTNTKVIAVSAGILAVAEPARTEITLAGAFVWNEVSGQKFGGPRPPTPGGSRRRGSRRRS